MIVSSSSRPSLFDNTSNDSEKLFNNGKYLISLLPDQSKVRINPIHI